MSYCTFNMGTVVEKVRFWQGSVAKTLRFYKIKNVLFLTLTILYKAILQFYCQLVAYNANIIYTNC
jgi:hypothetical protein